MNVPEYIASGILESYVLGTVSDQERREVECLSAIYPEIQRELNELSQALEGYALTQSIDPPADLKRKIMNQLTFEPAEVAETVVKPLPVTGGPTYRTTWMVAAAAGLLGLIFAYFLYSQLRQAQQSSVALRTANESLTEEMRTLRDKQRLTEQRLALLQEPGTRLIELRGNDKAPSGRLLVYWNARKQQVNVDVKSLPALPPDQQYQLWSLVGGQPVDAGVFEVTSDGSLQTMNRSIAAADAFAVTIEKRGGSPTPTLSALVMMEKLTS